MKRMGNVLVAVAMMVGALGATGCKRSNDQAAQQDTAPVAATAAQNDAPANTTADEATTVVSASVKMAAPPALRVENPGRAPSTHHIWRRGYWRWDTPTTVYVWAPGYWEDTTVFAPYAPPPVRYEYVGYAPADGYYFVPGYWRWSGVEYTWYYGHWSYRSDVGYYYRPRWENVNGRWVGRYDRWDADRREYWDRDHRGHFDGDRGYYGRFDGDRGHQGHFDGDRGHTQAQPRAEQPQRPTPAQAAPSHEVVRPVQRPTVVQAAPAREPQNRTAQRPAPLQAAPVHELQNRTAQRPAPLQAAPAHELQRPTPVQSAPAHVQRTPAAPSSGMSRRGHV